MFICFADYGCLYANKADEGLHRLCLLGETLLFHHLDTAFYKIVQRFACEHVVLQQGDVY